LHRTLIVWLFAGAVMITVSLATKPVYKGAMEGDVAVLSLDRTSGVSDYRLWAGLLFVCTVVLWWWFR